MPSIYRSLDAARKEIRLLYVRPGRPGDPVACDICYTHLASPSFTPFEAVSYVWGDASIRGDILVDGVELSVPASAEAVLRKFRLPEKSRLIWIDAVCIDQQNVVEKSQQVAMMAEIYASATKALVWLGEPPEAGEEFRALSALDSIWNDARTRTDDFESFLDTIVDSTGQFGRRTLDDKPFKTDGDLNYDALLQLFRSPWFTRVWVVQEACLASCAECHYGNSKVDFVRVARVAAWLNHHRATLPFHWNSEVGLANASQTWTYADRQQGPYSKSSSFRLVLFDCIRSMGRFRATEPRDYVYGLLGLYLKLASNQSGAEHVPDLLKPDYSIPLHEMLRRTTLHVILEDQSLRCLNWSDISGRSSRAQSDRLPSWVPRWDRPQDPHLWAAPFAPFFTSFGGNTKHEVGQLKAFDVWQENGPLPAEGIAFDEVISVWSPFERSMTMEDRLAPIVAVLQILLSNGFDEIMAITMIATTLCGSIDINHIRVTPDAAKSGFDAWLAYMNKNGRLPTDEDEKDENTCKAFDYFRVVQLQCTGRTLFLTRNGRLGLGPKDMATGDQVAVLWGCPWPVILGRAEEVTQRILIGTAYVHGVMDGEAVKAHEEAGAESELFWLC